MSIGTAIRDLVLAEIPWLSYLGRFRCRVTKHTSGRLDVEPITATWIKPIPLRDVWHGLPGCRSEPAVGDEVVLEFIDRNPSMGCITGFPPLSQSKPVHVEIDASGTIDLGGGTKTVHRAGDLGDGGTFTAAPPPASVIYTAPNGDSWTLTLTSSTGLVTASFVPVLGTVGKLVSKANPSDSRVRA